MRRSASLLAVLGIGLCLCGGLFADDPTKSPTSTKGRRGLPPGWSKLGLSDQQKQRILGIQAGFSSRIEMLQRQVKDLQEQERKAMYAQLTDAQKAQLKDIIAAKAGEAKDDTKPDTGIGKDKSQ